MKNNKTLSSLVLFVSIFLMSTNSYSDALSTSIVKLYSDGKLVGEWEAINEGHMEGQCFVFNIKKGVNTPQVRVCGTFGVENKR